MPKIFLILFTFLLFSVAAFAANQKKADYSDLNTLQIEKLTGAKGG